MECLKFLLKHPKIQVNVKDNENKRTALHYAANDGCMEAVRMLVEKQAVFSHDIHGHKCMAYAENPVEDGSDYQPKNTPIRTQIVKYLIECGAEE